MQATTTFEIGERGLMFGNTRPSNTQSCTGTTRGIGTLYRRICGLVLSPIGLLRKIRRRVAMAETETSRITDQSGYLKVLVYERKYRGVAESFEDWYEDVIRIESPRPSPAK